MMPVPEEMGTTGGTSSPGAGHGPDCEGVRVTRGLRAGVTLLTGVSNILGFGVCVAVAVALAVVAAEIGACGLLAVLVDLAVGATSTLVAMSGLRCAIGAVGSDSDVGPQATTNIVTSACASIAEKRRTPSSKKSSDDYANPINGPRDEPRVTARPEQRTGTGPATAALPLPR